MLIGSKTDLVKANPLMRKVSKEDAENYAIKENLLYEETSAITPENINNAVEVLIKGLIFDFLNLIYRNL